MIIEDLAFGIDLGIGSCGWAVLRQPRSTGEAGAIEGIGSWIFDVPETDKERTPTNQIRRGNRLLRRVIRRRRNRMSELRRLFRQSGLLSTDSADALKLKGLDPWELRARGLDKQLTCHEFAVALGHIAKRRGFKSAAKNKSANTAGDDQKMLKALEATRERLGRYQTVGHMFARDPDFVERKRNRDGIYDRTASRDDLMHEVGVLFSAQRRYGNPGATTDLEDAYRAIAFRQMAMQDSEKLVGPCPFEKEEKRAAKLAPSFERFRLLTRLINLRVTTPEGERPLSPDELARATSDLGKTKSLTVKKIRDLIGLSDDQRFTTIKSDQEKGEITSKTGDSMPGTAALRKALGDALWREMLERPEQLDQIAHVLSFFETSARIEAQLRDLGIPAMALGALVAALNDGKFASFKGAAHVSAKAVRALLPHLEQGKRYDEACALAGYNHAASSLSHVDHVTDKASFNALVAEVGENIANPIARKALTEGLKQLWAMKNIYGLPGAIYIELARDVGNSLEKRREMEKRIDDTTTQRNRERQEARDLLGIEDINGDTLLRYRLWKEQGGRCLYTDQPITPDKIIATDSSVQVDHILPWSRFGDDSYNNKTLCLASANQRKKRDTPFEWFSKDKNPDDWEKFVEIVESNKALRGFKKRNYLLKSAKDAEERFRSRNLSDTRYACRLLAEAVKLFYPRGERQEKDSNRRVFTRPGQLTAALRTAWGLESLKKVDGKRLPDDRHHALDALVVAAVSEAEVQKLTKSFQEWEQQGLGRPLRRVPEPWKGFREQAKAAYGLTPQTGVFVARPERRRARGEGHEATIRQLAIREDREVVYERKPVAGLTEVDLSRIKDPERNTALIEALRIWIKAGSPKDAPPKSHAGHEIVKVRMEPKKKIAPAISVRGGTAKRGEMVRIDVFSKPKQKGKDAGKEEFYLVPIYPHQIANKKAWPQPPSKASVAGKDESDWVQIDDTYRFKFSIHPRSYIEAIKSDGVIVEGYLMSFDRSVAAFVVGHQHDLTPVEKKTGAKTLLSINKYTVDRFGNKSRVRKEVRTWHGVACTSPSPPG